MASRKYVDLIHNATSKWPNWDPPNQIKAGDYGTIDVKTGDFLVDGNVYNDVGTFGLTTTHHPQIQAAEDAFEAASEKTMRRELVLKPGLRASIQGRWEFGANRGALLIMARPRIDSIPFSALSKLNDHPSLKGKSLVTAVFACLAYSIYLSNGKKDVISLALLGQLPVPGAPVVTADGETGASWWKQEASGVFRHACDKKGSYCYTPLYHLKEIGALRRDGRGVSLPIICSWVDSITPWNPLDDDGEEVEMEDTLLSLDFRLTCLSWKTNHALV
ncbi:hypothetical protein K439DRAFT_1642559 [Ramaria rubella]|nr:hypothetical protein K439DRAFT_1642559 [Ramaria rubella]